MTASQALFVSGSLVGVGVDAVRVVEDHVVLERIGARGGDLEDLHGTGGRDDRVRRSHCRNDALHDALCQSGYIFLTVC